MVFYVFHFAMEVPKDSKENLNFFDGIKKELSDLSNSIRAGWEWFKATSFWKQLNSLYNKIINSFRRNHNEQHETSQNNKSFEMYFWNDEKKFWIDVSQFNKLDFSSFKEWNNSLWNSKKEDTRWVSFIYIRARKKKEIDSSALKHYNNIKKYNETAPRWRKIAVWSYAFFDKSDEGMSEKWIEQQVNEYISIYRKINQSGDWCVDLTPMLDFEFESKYPKAESREWKRYKEAVLKRLKLFQQKTGIKPWIYCNAALYRDYFNWDNNFKNYATRIASYTSLNNNQSYWMNTVNVWSWNNTVQIDSTLTQFSDSISCPWLWTSNGKVDWNTTTKNKFKQLILKNNDSPSWL